MIARAQIAIQGTMRSSFEEASSLPDTNRSGGLGGGLGSALVPESEDGPRERGVPSVIKV